MYDDYSFIDDRNKDMSRKGGKKTQKQHRNTSLFLSNDTLVFYLVPEISKSFFNSTAVLK